MVRRSDVSKAAAMDIERCEVSKAAAMDVEMIQPQDDTEALHDQIVDQLMALPKGVSLGDATYKDHFIKDANVHTGNFVYKCPDSGVEYETVLIGEILPKSCGTKFSAMGNHYLGPTSSVSANISGVYSIALNALTAERDYR
jgi:hypothetical protein